MFKAPLMTEKHSCPLKDKRQGKKNEGEKPRLAVLPPSPGLASQGGLLSVGWACQPQPSFQRVLISDLTCNQAQSQPFPSETTGSSQRLGRQPNE